MVREAFNGDYSDVPTSEGVNEEFIVQGGPVLLEEMHATYNYDKFFELYVNSELEGHASAKRLRLVGDGTGTVELDQNRTSEVMYMHYTIPPGEEVAKMRYKTAAQNATWHGGRPGADWVNVFRPEVTKAELPGLSETPDLAEFQFRMSKVAPDKKAAKAQPTQLQQCATKILQLRKFKPEYMGEKDHELWKKFIATWPEKPGDVHKVPACKLPLHRLVGRQPSATTKLDRRRAAGSAGSSLDPMDKPLVLPLTDSKDAAKAKKINIKALLEQGRACSLLPLRVKLGPYLVLHSCLPSLPSSLLLRLRRAHLSSLFYTRL